jgi:hypothetical protein
MTCSSICDLEFVLLLWPTFCPKCGERAPLSHWRAQTSNSPDFRSDGPALEIYQILQPFNRQMMDDTPSTSSSSGCTRASRRRSVRP